MKLLHILKSDPDENTKTFIEILSEGEEAIEVSLYEDAVDYEKLIDMIFEHDKVITWW
jgi:sulfur transfer complex TusBCD TusB component (DsrH family)